jgi:hypothetical protein
MDDEQDYLAWRKSTKSLNGNCVEVAFADNYVLVRDSKNRQGGF